MKKTAPPLLAIALLSAAALAYQVLLLRLFAIVQWQHFAAMIISLALLGYAASGTFLVLSRRWLEGHFNVLFSANAILFGLSATACFLLVQQLPFNPPQLLWDADQSLYLALMYLCLALPFFFVANGIGLSFYRFRKASGKIYSADLVGAGIGAIGVLVLLLLFPPLSVLVYLSVLAILIGLLNLWRNLWFVSITLVLLTGSAIFLPAHLHFQISPYKSLSQTLQIRGSKQLQQASSPLGLLSVVASPQVPFRYAPGLSLNASQEPPPQLGIFNDGEGPIILTQYQGKPETLAYLDYLTSALPYHLRQQPKVLILGAGGGHDVLQAVYHQASAIDAVEANPQLIQLVKDDYGDFTGQLYQRPEVQLYLSSGRNFIQATQAHYDVIQLALVDDFGVANAGLSALNENYLYTQEALAQLLTRLKPDALLSITRWLKLPPRDALKLFATAVMALQQQGQQADLQLLLIRGWHTTTLLIKNGLFTSQDIQTVKDFCAERSFDIAYYPGISVQETNQYNMLQQPYFYQGAMALLSPQARQWQQAYKYAITPASDNQPYFLIFSNGVYCRN
ncbi:spermine/spermidine synthase domain-containing protein [Candidatus Venteria ishoeyi]|uniref:Spermidine synthase n=1 Tax=Candidatus Venteria ishoeyi TaxID=1899563 RepID=A0A1H6F8P0_9GAMM|nr:hypothetical protein [Candidatus Venteria ishoeyi]SEH06460.1 spermidine synthase [Candidatus Venteria ishoeyi]